MIKGNCESCGKQPPRITIGEFAGQPDMFDYCRYCSMDLCLDCMKNKPCEESIDGKHDDTAGDYDI